MSTQSNNGIPLSHFPDGVSYKLLELPAELVTLLESSNPPTLTLTSSPTAALLKTSEKNYSFRQKNTSNALIILSTSQSSESPGLNAIATVHDTVELVPETEDAKAPAAAARGKWHEKFGRTR